MLVIIEPTKEYLGFETKYKYFACENGEIFSEFSNSYLKYEITKDGYARVSIKRRHFLVHRLIAKAFIENPDNKPEINHKNQNRLDNSANNLEWSTRKENVNYKPTYDLRVKNINRGEDCNFSILTEEDVVEIMHMINSGISCNEISVKYNVTPKTIRNIKNKKTWKHLSNLLY